MKAIVVREFGGPEVLTYEDLPDVTPGAGQVLVQVEAVGVNPVDTYIRSGMHSFKPALPYTPGTDASGTVEAVGPGVSSVAVGDRVYVHGTPASPGRYAELTVADQAHVHRLPTRTSFQQGAALGIPYATAWSALFIRAKAHAGETVLVHGASGGVGIAAVQIARMHGLRVIGTAGTERGRALVREQGAHHVLDHTNPDYWAEIDRLTERRGVDVVLEMLANVNLDRDLDVISMRGRVVVIGSRGRHDVDPRKTMRKDASILGMLLFNSTPAELEEIHAAIVAGLETGVLNPVIGRELPLSEARAAQEAVLAPGALGKIVLLP